MKQVEQPAGAGDRHKQEADKGHQEKLSELAQGAFL
jgi:hypothetical protein